MSSLPDDAQAQARDRLLDEALEDSFPASDPIAISGRRFGGEDHPPPSPASTRQVRLD